jgi:hypothetical protein
MSGMAVIVSIPNSSERWRGNLEDLILERGSVKSAENLGASLFKRDLSNYTTFSQVVSLDSPFKVMHYLDSTL